MPSNRQFLIASFTLILAAIPSAVLADGLSVGGSLGGTGVGASAGTGSGGGSASASVGGTGAGVGDGGVTTDIPGLTSGNGIDTGPQQPETNAALAAVMDTNAPIPARYYDYIGAILMSADNSVIGIVEDVIGAGNGGAWVLVRLSPSVTRRVATAKVFLPDTEVVNSKISFGMSLDQFRHNLLG